MTHDQDHHRSRRPPAPSAARLDSARRLKGLGLNRIGRRASVADTPANRGMIAKVAHLVRVVDGQ